MEDMIVENLGYLKLEQVLELKDFSIYKTNKNTEILVKETHSENIELFFHKKDRLPYKIAKGKKICTGKKIFDSEIDNIKNISTENWNNKNQILVYETFIYQF